MLRARCDTVKRKATRGAREAAVVLYGDRNGNERVIEYIWLEFLRSCGALSSASGEVRRQSVGFDEVRERVGLPKALPLVLEPHGHGSQVPVQ